MRVREEWQTLTQAQITNHKGLSCEVEAGGFELEKSKRDTQGHNKSKKQKYSRDTKLMIHNNSYSNHATTIINAQPNTGARS